MKNNANTKKEILYKFKEKFQERKNYNLLQFINFNLILVPICKNIDLTEYNETVALMNKEFKDLFYANSI